MRLCSNHCGAIDFEVFAYRSVRGELAPALFASFYMALDAGGLVRGKLAVHPSD
jgi:hypothetical protein